MPAQSRAQRRRTNTRTRPASAPKPRIYSSDETTTAVAEVAPVMAAETAAAASSSRVARRLRTRSAPEPIDYSKEYRDVGGDLRLIALWSGLLFLAMLALYFARANGLF